MFDNIEIKIEFSDNIFQLKQLISAFKLNFMRNLKNWNLN